MIENLLILFLFINFAVLITIVRIIEKNPHVENTSTLKNLSITVVLLIVICLNNIILQYY